MGAAISVCCSCGPDELPSSSVLDGSAGQQAGAIRDNGAAASRETGWRAVPGVDPACGLQTALDPQAVVPSLESKPCDGVAGCRELVFPALPDGAFVRINPVEAGARWDDVAGTGLFSWFVVAAGQRPSEYTLADATGRTRQVWRIDPSSTCRLGALSGGGGRAAVAVRKTSPIGGATIAVAALDDPSSATKLADISSEEMPGQIVQYMPMSASAIALNTTGGAQLWHVSNGGSASRLAWGAHAEHYVDDVQDDAIFATDVGARTQVLVSAGGGSYSPFILPEDGSDAFELRTDGKNLVWKQGYGRLDVTTYERVELWTSPYTTNTAELVPRRLVAASLPAVHNQTDTHSGVVIDATSDGTRYLAHFVDGSPTREIRAPEGRVQKILFAGPEEVAMLVYENVPRVLAVRFLRYDELPIAKRD